MFYFLTKCHMFLSDTFDKVPLQDVGLWRLTDRHSHLVLER